MPIQNYLLLTLLPLVGGIGAFFFSKKSDYLLKMILSFSGAFILGITITHLLPEVYMSHFKYTSLFIILGFLLQLLLDQLTKGVEHGHMHIHGRPTRGFILSILIGLCIHAFIEGVPLGGIESLEHHHHAHPGHSHPTANSSALSLLWGIAIHKIPAAFALVTILIVGLQSKVKTILCLLLFVSMSPLGALVGSAMTSLAGLPIFDIAMALTIGSFLHIASTILFEAGTTHHQVDWQRLSMIILGFGVACLGLF